MMCRMRFSAGRVVCHTTCACVRQAIVLAICVAEEQREGLISNK